MGRAAANGEGKYGCRGHENILKHRRGVNCLARAVKSIKQSFMFSAAFPLTFGNHPHIRRTSNLANIKVPGHESPQLFEITEKPSPRLSSCPS